MAKITYEDKVALEVNPDIADINLCKASDLNQIKTVVNTNDTNALYKSNIKTSKTTSASDVYSCTYVNTVDSTKLDKTSVKTSKTTSASDVYSTDYINTLENTITNLSTKLTALQNQVDSSVAYCRMAVYGVESISTDGKIITSFAVGTSYGGFVANESAGYLFIPKGTKAVETSGLMCGYGYAAAEIRIVDATGVQADYYYGHTGLLIQTAGNGYWRAALPNCIVTLDERKDYYAYLYASGYNGQNFEINNGFGTSGAWYGVKKIR